MKVEVGKKYKHFKGMIVEVIALAKHSETLEEFVVYTHDGENWIRPYNLFVSKIDKDKYPNVLQEYRFEEVTEND